MPFLLCYENMWKLNEDENICYIMFHFLIERAFQRHQESDLKHPQFTGSYKYKPKQTNKPSFIELDTSTNYWLAQNSDCTILFSRVSSISETIMSEATERVSRRVDLFFLRKAAILYPFEISRTLHFCTRSHSTSSFLCYGFILCSNGRGSWRDLDGRGVSEFRKLVHEFMWNFQQVHIAQGDVIGKAVIASMGHTVHQSAPKMRYGIKQGDYYW